MIDTQDLETGAKVHQTVQTVGQVGTPSKPNISVAEVFLRFLVVVAGIILGSIAALIIGLATDWISLAC